MKDELDLPVLGSDGSCTSSHDRLITGLEGRQGSANQAALVDQTTRRRQCAYMVISPAAIMNAFCAAVTASAGTIVLRCFY